MATLLGVGLMACQEPSVVKERGSKDNLPDQASWESTIIISRDGRLVAVAQSDSMVMYAQRPDTLRGNVKVEFYNRLGQHISHLDADSAVVDMTVNNLSAFGHVVFRSDSGLVLFTSTLLWDDQYEMVTTTDTVTFTTPDSDTLYGVGFESDVDLTHWKIYQPWGVTERSFRVDD